MKRALVLLVFAATALYAADYLRLRYRMATNRDAFGSVTRDVYLLGEAQERQDRIQLRRPAGLRVPQHSLLPQYWEKPCWLARRQKEVQIDIDSGNPQPQPVLTRLSKNHLPENEESMRTLV